MMKRQFRSTSTEWSSFKTLYWISMEEMQEIDFKQCSYSAELLDKAASVLFKRNRSTFPPESTDLLKGRNDVIALLKEGKYSEAEDLSAPML
ncbi:hypothetical protein N7528_008201 [Penicillium herquei]|nr:hypothetical protein N7528_008201 [Penicillium herquei]